jgi:hypothetical protein
VRMRIGGHGMGGGHGVCAAANGGGEEELGFAVIV